MEPTHRARCAERPVRREGAQGAAHAGTRPQQLVRLEPRRAGHAVPAARAVPTEIDRRDAKVNIYLFFAVFGSLSESPYASPQLGCNNTQQ